MFDGVSVPRRNAPTDHLRVGVVALGGLGGSGRVACDLARGLADSGHAVVLLTCAAPQFEAEHGPRVQHVAVRAPRTPQPAGAWVDALADDLVQAVRQHRLHLLAVHYGVGLAEAAVRARDRLAELGTAVRVAVTLHGSDVTRLAKSPAEGRRLRQAVARADAVTTVSHHLADAAQQTLGLVHPPRVIANSVDPEVFFPGDALSDTWQLCHASNFRPIKRPLDNIDVLERLRDRGLDVHLSMIGDGPLRAATQRRVAERGLLTAVSFIDPLPQPGLADHLRAADVVLVTSECESFGLVGLEAMASGTPVIGTLCGGLEELLAADVQGSLADGLLAVPGDTDGLARRAEALLVDDRRRADVRRRCLLVGRTQFGRARQLDAYAALLRALQAETRP